MGISVACAQSGFSSTISRSNWNLEMSVFAEGEQPLEQGRKPTTNSTHVYGINSGNQTWATLVEGECSHHCAIRAPLL